MTPICQVAVPLLALLVLQYNFAEAIRCHNCSYLQEGCDDIKDDNVKFLIDCNEEPNGSEFQFCRKIDMWVDFKVNGQEPFKRVLRQCAIAEEPGKPCYYKAGLGGRVNVCHCKVDGCNGSPTLSIIHSVLVVPLLAVIYKFL